MSNNNSKILHLNSIQDVQTTGGAVCYGHFNLLHPGHMRFLEKAASSGTGLTILVKGDKHLNSGELVNNYSELERAKTLAALSFVTHVYILGDLDFSEALIALSPKEFFLGNEYKSAPDKKLQKLISNLINRGVNVRYDAGTTRYLSVDDFDSLGLSEDQIRLSHLKKVFERQEIVHSDLSQLTKNFSSVNLIVVGDTILDRYTSCDALGMSAEAPVVVLRELADQTFTGGAAIVAAHIKSFGAQCHFISVVGNDDDGSAARQRLTEQNVAHNLVVDDTRPTTVKTRFMVEKQKMFRLSRLDDRDISAEIESKVIKKLYDLAPSADGILISDFNYGCITKNVLEVIEDLKKEHKLLLFGDTQCSSQTGNILKFKGFNLITPTEREARISLRNKDDSVETLANSILRQSSCPNLILKLGVEGFICYSSTVGGSTVREHFPALSNNPIDVTGAGDSLIAAMAVSMCAGAKIMEAATIGAITASIAVNTLGNTPVSISKVRKVIEGI